MIEHKTIVVKATSWTPQGRPNGSPVEPDVVQFNRAEWVGTEFHELCLESGDLLKKTLSAIEVSVNDGPLDGATLDGVWLYHVWRQWVNSPRVVYQEYSIEKSRLRMEYVMADSLSECVLQCTNIWTTLREMISAAPETSQALESLAARWKQILGEFRELKRQVIDAQFVDTREVASGIGGDAGITVAEKFGTMLAETIANPKSECVRQELEFTPPKSIAYMGEKKELEPLVYRLILSMRGSESRPAQEVVDEVWGDGTKEQKDGSIRNAVSKANAGLSDVKYKRGLSYASGYISWN